MTVTEPANGIIGLNLPCSECGYNLRTLRLDARCPECNHGVAASIESWQKRWEIALSKGRRTLLLIGTLLLLTAAVLSQLSFDGRYEFQAAIGCGLELMAWLAIVLITAVRWDQGKGGWATIPRVTRLFASMGLLISWVFPLAGHRLGIDVRVILELAYIYIAILTTTFLYIHLARVANRAGWPWISRQAMVVTVLIAVGSAVVMLAPSFIYYRLALLPGIGSRFEIKNLLIQSSTVSVVTAWPRVDLMATYLSYYPREIPILLATLGAVALMVQLTLSAATRSRPPRVAAFN